MLIKQAEKQWWPGKKYPDIDQEMDAMKGRKQVRCSLMAAFAAAVTGLILVFPAWALDCPSLRLLPGLRADRVLAEGLVRAGKPRNGETRRDRLRGLLSRPAAGDTVIVNVGSASRVIRLDEQGAFCCDFSRPAQTGAIVLSVSEPSGGTLLRKLEQRLPASSALLVVSDIDDTVLVSEVPTKVKLIYNSLLRSVANRRPVPGVPDAYRNIRDVTGSSGLFVYLSASPAAMERFIGAFLNQNGFPDGLLITGDRLSSSKEKTVAHKTAWLSRLAGLFPGAPMLLIGDSGEQDPEIYTAFAVRGMARIRGVIIRGIGQVDEKRKNALGRQLEKAGIPFFVWRGPEELRAVLARLGFRTP